MKSPSASSPIAFSYIRFSTPEQAQGDSLRRQTEAAAEWCVRNDVTLDASTTLQDLGKSAYTGKHRENPDRHALAAFLKLVEAGKVPRGCYLIIENLDRLSREHIQPALLLALNLLQAGIRIVQLKPAEMVFDDQSDTLPVMIMMMELSRGHSESAIKSERNGKVWRTKRAAARAGKDQPPRRKDGRITQAITGRLPAWVEDRGGKLCLIPERAAVVKHIFELAAAGYGQGLIVKKLTEEGVPAFGEPVVREGKKRSAYSGKWLRAYVAKLLRDRRAVGELTPCSRGGKPEEPMPGYYPRAIDDDLWHAARAGAAQRDRLPGKPRMGRGSKYVHLFANLLHDARDGGAMYLFYRGTAQRFLINAAGSERHEAIVTFPLDVFEQAILSCLREIDPHEILNGDHGPDESLVLASELARVEGKIAELEAELLEGDVAALAKVLRQLEEKKRDLAARLAEARQRAAHPLSESWGEAQTLAEALDAAPDPTDARLRLRAALRRIVESVWLLVVPRGRDRLAAVQVWFAGGKRHRDYLVLHRPPMSNGKARVEGGWWCRSLADAAALGELDLRKRGHAQRLERALTTLELNT